LLAHTTEARISQGTPRANGADHSPLFFHPPPLATLPRRMGGLHALDWAILLAYFALMQWAGMRYAGRASRSLDEYFLSGRVLPWWLAGTSMVATSFSADTPLLVSGWVRDFGIWKNWAWWCYAVSGCLQVFLFARWWRRAGVMTKAEVVELRYGGAGARVLRGTLGALHAGLTNTLIMAWVLLAATKISKALFAVDERLALAIASVLALSYSVTAGLWGVVATDLVQFTLAMVGATLVGVTAWEHVGGAAGAHAAVLDGRIAVETLALFPPAGPGGLLEPSFWTVSLAAACVYLGVSWWAVESVDGAGAAVQRISASKDERAGLLATLWFAIAHYALRPWPWIVVGLASLLVLPTIEIRSRSDGIVRAVEARAVVLGHPDGSETRFALDAAPAEADWMPELPRALRVGDELPAGALIARTDSEGAYVVMMKRYLPAGLLGLAIAALVAAFMSTIDTHANLAAAFFVNDVWRRFVDPDGSTARHILVARLASAAALGIAALIAAQSDSIRDLFLYFLALLGGVGPVYVLRWLWWRVRASTELTAMGASVLATFVVSRSDRAWSLGPLSVAGELTPEGRLLLVVAFSTACALVSMLVTRAPDPRHLVEFYRRVRPVGAWGPVRALCPDVAPPKEMGACLAGSAGGLALVYGLMLAPGYWLLERPRALACSLAIALAGAWLVARALRRLAPRVTPSGRS
jgi:SSS family solute:Na+ symporter